MPRILVAGGPVERRVNHVLAALVGFMAGACVGFGILLVVVHHNGVANCRQIEVVKTGLRETILEASHFTTSSPIRTLQEKQQATMFYRDALERLKPRKC
jgi:hypothetical protein